MYITFQARYLVVKQYYLVTRNILNKKHDQQDLCHINQWGTQNLIFTSILYKFRNTQLSLLLSRNPFHFWYSHIQIKVSDRHNLRSFLTFYYHMNYPNFTMFYIHSFCLQNFISTSSCSSISACINITFYHSLNHHDSTMYQEVAVQQVPVTYLLAKDSMSCYTGSLFFKVTLTNFK